MKLAAVLVAVAAAGSLGACSRSGSGTVQVYTVDESISTVVTPADRPGRLARLAGMCDADTYYMRIDGTEQCIVLNGSLATLALTGNRLDAGLAAALRTIARNENATRLVLGHDGDWAGIIDVTALDATPATLTPIT